MASVAAITWSGGLKAREGTYHLQKTVSRRKQKYSSIKLITENFKNITGHILSLQHNKNVPFSPQFSKFYYLE